MLQSLFLVFSYRVPSSSSCMYHAPSSFFSVPILGFGRFTKRLFADRYQMLARKISAQPASADEKHIPKMESKLEICILQPFAKVLDRFSQHAEKSIHIQQTSTPNNSAGRHQRFLNTHRYTLLLESSICIKRSLTFCSSLYSPYSRSLCSKKQKSLHVPTSCANPSEPITSSISLNYPISLIIQSILQK